VVYRPTRKRLPKSRPSRTTSFSVGGAEGYLTSGSYPDDGLGEVFLKLGKQGSTLAGVMDAFAIAVSVGLQYGVPLETFVQKFTNLKFEPAGLTDGSASSSTCSYAGPLRSSSRNVTKASAGTRRKRPIRTDSTAPELTSAYMTVLPTPSRSAASSTVNTSGNLSSSSW